MNNYTIHQSNLEHILKNIDTISFKNFQTLYQKDFDFSKFNQNYDLFKHSLMTLFSSSNKELPLIIPTIFNDSFLEHTLYFFSFCNSNKNNELFLFDFLQKNNILLKQNESELILSFYLESFLFYNSKNINRSTDKIYIDFLFRNKININNNQLIKLYVHDSENFFKFLEITDFSNYERMLKFTNILINNKANENVFIELFKNKTITEDHIKKLPYENIQNLYDNFKIKNILKNSLPLTNKSLINKL